jgi:hypothetical protein
MKNVHLFQKMLVLSIFCLFFASFAAAQVQNSVSRNADYYRVSNDGVDFKSNLSVSAGPNFYQLVNKLDNLIKKNIPQTDSLKYGNFSTSGQPTLQIAYDYSFNEHFSLGIAYSRNAMFFKFDSVKFTAPIENSSFEGNISLRLARNTFTLRPMVHYGQSEKIDMYSGLRLGLTVWTTLVKGEIAASASEEIQKNFKGRFGRTITVWPNASATLFGIRYYPIPNLGIGAEINVGPPYPLAVSANFRF